MGIIKMDGNTKKSMSQVLQGIKVMPATVSARIISDLMSGVDKKRASDFLKSDLDLDIMTEKEQFRFLKQLYNFSRIEDFNPIKATLKDAEDKQDDKRKEKESKDSDKSLYYDFDFKIKFADEYRETTARVVRALFRKTAELEKLYDKDLYEFNIKELGDVLTYLKAGTIRSLQNSISTIEQYIDFAYKEGRLEFRVNLANAFDSKKKIEKYLNSDAEENMIFDKDEIMAMADESDNAQDGVILALLFDGVSHKNEFNELINLTRDNVDLEEKKIKLEGRTIDISQETYLLIKEALTEDNYYSISGEKTRKYKITEGKNILRGLRNKLKVKGQIISQRILRMAEHFEYEYLNATNVSYSGQLHYAKELLDSGLDIDSTVDKVLYRFGVPSNTSSQWYLKTRIEKYLGLEDN